MSGHCKLGCTRLIRRAFSCDFIVPEFNSFCQELDKLYASCKWITGGRVASYIPQLANSDPNCWAVAVCTTDGRRYCTGDAQVFVYTGREHGCTSTPFTLAVFTAGHNLVSQP